jgi:purine-nucleoside phosphorylase
LVSDHLNLTGDNPLVGQNDPEWGPRFQDLTDAWDPGLRAVLSRAALESGVELREGIVAGVPVSSRSAAERGMLRILGADMASTGFVAEAITGRHAGRRMAGLAVTSDQGAESLQTVLGPFVEALEGADIPE